MHDMKLCYFCLDCDQSLCPDCYIEDHLGHSKRRLKDVFAEKKSLIKESLEELKSHEKALTQQINSSDLMVKEIEEQKVDESHYKKFIDVLKIAIESEKKEKVKDIKAWKESTAMPAQQKAQQMISSVEKSLCKKTMKSIVKR